MSVVQDLATYLQTLGIGTVGTNIYYSYVHGQKNEGIFVLDTPGPAPDPDIPTKNPSIQVFIRWSPYADGKAKLDAVRDALHRVSNQLIGSTYFYNILAVSEGGHIGVNASGADEFSINFQTLIR